MPRGRHTPRLAGPKSTTAKSLHNEHLELARCPEGQWLGRTRITTVTYFGANPHQSTRRAAPCRAVARGKAVAPRACQQQSDRGPRGHITRHMRQGSGPEGVPQGGGSSPEGGTPLRKTEGSRACYHVHGVARTRHGTPPATRGTGVITSRVSHNASATSA